MITWLDKLRRGLLGTTAQAVLEPVLKSPIPLPISHYMYFPTEETAEEVAAELNGRGFRTEMKRAASGPLWLTLAQHEILPTDERLAALRTELGRIATDAGGEYDGWEAKIARH